jgi:hypothetical protein
MHRILFSMDLQHRRTTNEEIKKKFRISIEICGKVSEGESRCLEQCGETSPLGAEENVWSSSCSAAFVSLAGAAPLQRFPGSTTAILQSGGGRPVRALPPRHGQGRSRSLPLRSLLDTAARSRRAVRLLMRLKAISRRGSRERRGAVSPDSVAGRRPGVGKRCVVRAV